MPDQYPPDMPQAQQVLQFIDRMRSEKRATLVHCNAGIGRTGTVLHLYYLAQGLSMEEAKARVRARRPQCILLEETSRQHDTYLLP